MPEPPLLSLPLQLTVNEVEVSVVGKAATVLVGGVMSLAIVVESTEDGGRRQRRIEVADNWRGKFVQ